MQVCGPLVGVIRFTLGGSSKRLFDSTRAFAKVCRKNNAAQGTGCRRYHLKAPAINGLWTSVAQTPPYDPTKALHSRHTRVADAFLPQKLSSRKAMMIGLTKRLWQTAERTSTKIDVMKKNSDAMNTKLPGDVP